MRCLHIPVNDRTPFGGTNKCLYFIKMLFFISLMFHITRSTSQFLPNKYGEILELLTDTTGITFFTEFHIYSVKHKITLDKPLAKCHINQAKTTLPGVFPQTLPTRCILSCASETLGKTSHSTKKKLIDEDLEIMGNLVTARNTR